MTESFVQMLSCGIPELSDQEDLKYVYDALRPHESEADATMYFTRYRHTHRETIFGKNESDISQNIQIMLKLQLSRNVSRFWQSFEIVDEFIFNSSATFNVCVTG